LDLDRFLHAIRRRWRTVAALRAAALALLAASLVLAAAAFVERWLQPPDTALLVLAALTAALLLAIAVACAWRVRDRPDDARVARFVEERCPELNDAIVTAVEIRRRVDRPDSFAPLVVASATARLAQLDRSRVIEPREFRAAGGRAAAAAAGFAIALVLALPFVEKAAQVAYIRAFPSSISVHVRSGDMRIPAGRPVTIAASVAGRLGTLGRIAPVVSIETAAGQTTTVPMTPSADGFELRIAALERSFKYKVAAGPAQSREYGVTALFPARVKRIEVHYDYPAFTGLKPRQESDGGDVYGPAGTRVRLIVHTDKSVASGRLAFAEGKPGVALARATDRTLESALTIQGEAAYRVGLVDADGLSSEGVEYFVRVMDDRPPDVHILRPSGDQQITPLEEVPIEARADDDYGIASFEMVYSVGGGAERVVPFSSVGGTAIARIGSRMLAAEDLKVKPGDVIAYYARASDVARAKRSTVARSEIFFLEVKPFNEEYSLAQSQAMAAGTGSQIEGLIAAQKEIISATWNLERRSGAGRSAGDIKDIADAQAELKARAEQAAGANRQRRRFGGQPFFQIGLPPAAAQQSAAGDPVRDAVEAMARALQQLQTQKTAGAIPHEMAALNALLQAQAEVRKRQVSQQQNAASGNGGNRQSQDLSNLFDRELKRQQKTNYESKAQVETTPETQKADTALDKIRDLARRQEELSRQQRELASGGLTEEEKRQLEKLTREQEELRRQAEQAARELGQQQQGAKGAQQGARGAKGAEGANSAQQDLNRALEQMREAAAQAKQEDAAGAAAKGEEAARQLRRAESQMQNGTPDAKRRALGDLQLESQQVAEAQQRVASEAERLDREGGGATDARRRLAGEKEQLADRVDALQQAAQRLGAEAARDLASEKISDRMRTGAQALRDGKAGRTAPAEQQIADALDKVARKIGGADAGGAKGQETEQLAGQLDEVRDARERLARLEKQIAEQQAGRSGRDGQPAARAGKAGQQPGRAGNDGPEGRQGQRGSGGEGQGSGDLQRLQQEYNRELQRTRELMDRVQRGTPQSGGRMATPEEHEWSRSAPGTEAFKQDYAKWQSLAGDVAKALERVEASVAARLSTVAAKDRLRAGGSERVPDAYKGRVSKYFESIATKRKTPPK
jgi:hypothetical protein